MKTAYDQLKDELKTINYLEGAQSLLSWDQEVMMPNGAADERSQILSTLSAVMHERSTSERIGELIKRAQDEVTDAWDVRNLAMIKEDYELAKALPASLVYETTEACNKALMVWQEAKPNSDWKKVEPYLKASFESVRKKADIFAQVCNTAPYDALLTRYARGNTEALIDPLFGKLKTELPVLVQNIMNKQPDKFVQFNIADDVQLALGRELAQTLGFSFDTGRLDVSSHPFSGGTKYDSRITTRISKEEPLSCFFSVIHETGHALYGQNTPRDYEFMPVGRDSDMSIHESQSLIFERMAAGSTGFISYLYDRIVSHDASFSNQISKEDFIISQRHVRPSFIRVEADEVTYPLHVILRYEIEKNLFNGSMTISDIPHVWNEKMKDMLGLDVVDHNKGCMQDIHWYWGLFGYFPTYTQGALYAAQLYDALARDIPDVETQIAQGDFKQFLGWLNKNIHQWGLLYDAPQLIENATGSKPDASYFLKHVEKRYLTA